MLSNTKRGKKWLEQFDADDVESATLLLDSLILVDQATLEDEMEKTLDDFLREHRGPVALFAAVERPKRDRRKRLTDFSKLFFPHQINQNNPNRKPENYASLENTGSEGAMLHFCRDYSKKKSRVLSHPGLEQMRKKKVRWIVCMDDVIGSGNRMKEFVEWIYEDKTIRSWHSFGWTRIAVFSFAASKFGREVLESIGMISEIMQCQYLSEGRDIWTQNERRSLEALCLKYAREKDLGFPLGYKSAFSMILFSHGCPNTNPAVLWVKKNGWLPLVTGIGRAATLLKEGVEGRKTQQERLLTILGQSRLTKPSLFQRLNPESQKLLLLLSCIAKKKRKVYVLGEMLGVPISRVEGWCQRCRKLGWIDENNILTLGGRNALKAARRNKCTGEYELLIKMDFYFPVSLRSPAGSSSVTPWKGSHGC